MSQEIISIHREKLATWGYKYTACMADGTQLVLRKQSTRPYAWAAIHRDRACTKFERGDIRGLITFHSVVPMAESRNPVIERFQVKEA